MANSANLSCTCGKVELELSHEPIIAVECCCTSCRTAGETFQKLPGAPSLLTPHGATPFVLYRKDRVRISEGADQLAEHRLRPDAHTRRIIATCCNTPIFVEFQAGHWLSIYGNLWPSAKTPAIALRTMAGDLPDPSVLPDDVPNCKTHNLSFFAKLLGAWIGMGFRVPKIHIARQLEI